MGRKINAEKFIEKAREVHGDEYDYSKVEYINYQTKVCIICPIHGEFWMTPNNHLNSTRPHKCPKCQHKSDVSSMEEFLSVSRATHNNKYDYSKVKYINNHTKVCIICPTHGEFWQMPSKHLCGQGCPKCVSSSLENQLIVLFDNEKINYQHQQRFEWLGRQSLDFYLPDYNIAIECQGLQHFELVEYFGGEKAFQNTLKRDERKKELCVKHGVKLLYFTNIKNHPKHMLNDHQLLLKEILKND